MWIIEPHRLILVMGVCVLIIGMFPDNAGAGRGAGVRRGMLQRLSDSRHKGRIQAQRGSSAGGRRKSRKHRKMSSKRKAQHEAFRSKPANPTEHQKTNASSNRKISVYNCPSEAVEMNCLSCKTKVYRNCPVAGANKITQVEVLTEYPGSFGRCKVGKKENFGISDDSNIWVNNGCRAHFLVCYDKGKHEPKTVNCMCTGTSSKHRCPMGFQGVNVNVKVNMLWSFGSGKCKEGDSWGYDKNDIWVDRGCSATFRIIW